ncbi:hypothetical protein [Allokutzneria oryzae]|uniref:CBM6 domain-containing protein n=1 Tax=Allokutzneria oryzae TaxID=1378989 RepID=A0ABV6A769_9PSEU
MTIAHRAAALGLATLLSTTLVATTGTAHAGPNRREVAVASCSKDGFRGELMAEKFLIVRPASGNLVQVYFTYRITPGNGRGEANVKVREGNWNSSVELGEQDGEWHMLTGRQLGKGDFEKKLTYRFGFIFDKKWASDPRCDGKVTI